MAITVHPESYPFVHRPYDHQMNTLTETWRKREYGIFWEMGCGKSKLICDNMGLLFLNGALLGAVTVAKKGEYLNWSRLELPTHMPPEVPYRAYEFNTYKWRIAAGQREWNEFMAPSKTPVFRVLVVNIEAFGTDGLDAAFTLFFKALKNEIMFVIDEATCVKNHSAKRSKVAYKWAAKAKMRRIMTGLPNPQSPMDLWGESLALRKGLLGCTTLTTFRARYAITERFDFGPRSFKKIVGYQRLEELHERLKSFSTIVSKEECLDLPEKIYKKVVVELTDQQKKLIEQIVKARELEIEGDMVSVTNALGLLTKVHQIICGQLKTDDGNLVSVENNRIQALLDVVEEHQGKAITWASYRQTLEDAENALVKVYGREAVAGYHGGTPQDDRPDIIKNFRDTGHPLRFLVANPQSAGYGLTLTSADLAVYYSNGYNLEHRLQSEDRIHRIGQTKRPVYVDLYVPGTVDEAIMDALRGKRNLSELVMRGEVSVRDWL